MNIQLVSFAGPISMAKQVDIFFLGGQDAEMAAIRELLIRRAIEFHDKEPRQNNLPN